MGISLGIGGGLIDKGDDSEQAARQANQLSQQGIDELRRQFDVTQAQFGVTQGNIDPFIQAGIGQLPGLQRGATPEGFGQNLASIFGGGALDPLIQERTRAAQGQLAAGGLTRSGTALQEISAIPQDIGLGIESLLFGRSANLAAGGQQAALGLGGLSGQLGQTGGQNAANIANLFAGQGAQLFQGTQADIQAGRDLASDFVNLAGTIGGAAAGGGFSDRRLKENIEPISKIGPLTLYQWDWIAETKDMIISQFPTMGFVADEVKKLFPEFVKNIAGFDAVDYRGLLNRIENEMFLEGVA